MIKYTNYQIFLALYFLFAFKSVGQISEFHDDQSEITGVEFNEWPPLNLFFYQRNLARDSYQCERKNGFNLSNLKEDLTYNIRGQLSYLGSYTGHYAYDTYFDGEKIILSTKIFFRNVSKKSIQHTESDYLLALKKVQWAEDYWNAEIPEGYNIHFKFEITKNKELAYFSPALVRKNTRGPYYAGWSAFWSPIVIAHEIGHMFGLDDEYENNFAGANTDLCAHDSLMCAHKRNSRLKEYHFKIILDRLKCF